jgi:hypothetical protein
MSEQLKIVTEYEEIIDLLSSNGIYAKFVPAETAGRTC